MEFVTDYEFLHQGACTWENIARKDTMLKLSNRLLEYSAILTKGTDVLYKGIIR